MTTPTRKPPAYLFALGNAPLPDPLIVDGVTWRFAKLFKHDFFAATALYSRGSSVPEGRGLYDPTQNSPKPQASAVELPSSLAVLKIQRTHHLFGFPMRWLGRLIANHEIRIYQTLQGIPGIPPFLGRVGATGFLHAFAPGAELTPQMPYTPEFFEQLRALLLALHARHVAYVDTNKRENILFGADGRPWLIDFQISWFSPQGPRANWFARQMLARLKRADWYHFYKHKTRLMPQHCTPDDFAKANQRGTLHNLHRIIARPLIDIRRRFLSRYKLEKVK